jgi:signal transduction histidine kinase
MDLQRMESGRLDVRPRLIDLRPLLKQAVAAVVDDLHPVLVEAADELPEVMADPPRILQVVTNLLANARKYSPRGGQIRVSARQVDGPVEVAVEDHGLGIAPEALPRLFDRFYRVAGDDRRRIQGTGLGLAIAKEIIEAHGGRIGALSDGPGNGSTFWFTLPTSA